MPYDTKVLNSFATSKRRAKVYGSFHDPVRKGKVDLGIPITFLVGASKECAAA